MVGSMILCSNPQCFPVFQKFKGQFVEKYTKKYKYKYLLISICKYKDFPPLHSTLCGIIFTALHFLLENNSEKMRPGLKRSPVWEFFKKSGEFVFCNLCKKQFKFSGNTSNLNDHLRRRHPGYLNVGASSARADISNVGPSFAVPCCSQMEGVIQICEVPSPQTLALELGNTKGAVPKKKSLQTKLVIADKRSELLEFERNDIDDSIIKMIATNLQPLSIVENEGFLEYSKKLQPLYKVPNRKLLSNKMLPFKYMEVLSKLKMSLRNVDHVAVTTDMWTSDSNRAFLTVTSHFIIDHKIRSAVLTTIEVPEKHTAENIGTALKNIFDDWSISNKVVTIVSDNGANIKKAISDNLKKHHHPCVAHTLNLCVVDAIKMNAEVANLLVKCRTIVSHFSHSTLATEKLKSMQRQMGKQEWKLKQDVLTRWNSSLIMLERILLVKEPLSAIITSLATAPEFLNALEWELISECIAVLKPIESMTVELSAEKYPTMSLVIPLVRGLQFTIKNQLLTSTYGDLFKNSLLEVIQTRLGQLELDKTCAKATFLDPRFKKIAFGNETNAANTQKYITEEVTFLLNHESSSTPVNAQMASYSYEIDESEDPDDTEDLGLEDLVQPKPISLWEMLDQKISQVKTTYSNAPSVVANLAVQHYLRADYLPRSQDPLTFWSAHKALSPQLFLLAQKYLCIPATSVPSERVFSKAGQIINDRRNRLKGEKLNQIIFLNSNIDW